MGLDLDKVRESAAKYAVFNASQYGGKANPGSVMGRIFAEYPEAKASAKDVQRLVMGVVADVNSWPLDKIMETVKQWPELFEAKKVEERKTMPPLRNVDKWPMVKVRFAPNPDGPLHLGSAESIIFSDEYAKMYKGHFILRFEDTSADVKPPIPQMYDWIQEDLKWLGVKVDEMYVQSERLAIYYEWAEKLLGMGAGYVCTCESEEYKRLYMAKEPCPCRELPPEEHLRRWHMMLDGEYKRGEAVVRVKTDLTHPNPAIRDWPALRISTRSHPLRKKKYRVWPLYNFSCAVDDHFMGISHVIRGKEHEVNSARQKYLYDHFGWQFPEVINVGRLGLEAGILSKSKIRAGVDGGVYTGWDDPRLGTLRALKRRGLQPETIREIMIQVGPKPINVMISWGNFAAANKKIIDPHSNRYFFVRDPVELKVKGVEEPLHAKLPLHPDHPERGFREYTIEPEGGVCRFLLPSKDLSEAKGKLIRLMGLVNVEVTKTGKTAEARFHSKEHQVAREKGAPFIHWLTEGNSVPAEVVMADASVATGRAESLVTKLNVDDTLQFERFGFVRVDAKEPLRFYYAHD
ncbi:MAG: glutamate--tRNA ligase [Candidatus Bathyarchaeota archaeon]|nr:glutamate--tRNA ligase [Candidatus Bathyarchaeota archaeon]